MDDERLVPHDKSYGHGDLLRCPKIMGDVACQGCDCETPCEAAHDYPDGIYYEQVDRNRSGN